MGKLYGMDNVHGQLAAILDGYGDKSQRNRLAALKARASGNIKARLRMITLYHIAQLTGGIVVSTDNLSELWMGFWTLNGDVGDLAPIQHIFKGLEEYEIARALGVPEDSLNAAPTDGLDILPGGTDEDQLGMPYAELDRVIVALLQEGLGKGEGTDHAIDAFAQRFSAQSGYPAGKIIHVAQQLHRTHYKRCWPKVVNRQELGLPAIEELSTE
jgi:NAD+ synthetase